MLGRAIIVGVSFGLMLAGAAFGQSSYPGYTPPTGGADDGGHTPEFNLKTFEQYRPWYIAPDPNARKPRQPLPVVDETPPPVVTPTRPVVQTPVYREIPWPMPRPIFVDIPLPGQSPIRTLGRPALLDAPYKPGSVVALMAQDGDKTPQELADELGFELVAHSALEIISGHLVEFKVPSGQSIQHATRLLLADNRFLGAHPNYLFEIQQSQSTPSSPLMDLQYAPKRMAISRAHQLSRGENVTVAVIDTGVDLSHGEFAADSFVSFDAVGSPGGETEPHGTAMAGVISANGNMIGMAPNAKMLAVRAFAQAEDGRFLSDSYTIARAINWAVINGADILNMSFAGPADPLILKLMDELGNRNILSVAAAGNNGIGAPAAYPAAHPATIAVTATDAEDALYTNANRGIYVTVAAPGVDVIAPAPGNTYNLVSGTSVATAHMTGVIALMLSQRRDLKPTELIAMLSSSAEDFGKPGLDPEFGYGLVDAFKATEFAGTTEIAAN